ncbi:MAG TPA: GNAT family N-acetyltransferase [Methylomirabilota bacterium]|nr:GNAT family N-acetyltransferase [Methylomirabilota bacterium]
MTPVLETARLRLRPLAASDEADLIALDSDPEVMRYVGSPAGVRTPAETAARARRRIRESERGEYEPLGFWRIEGRADRAFHGVGALIRMPDAGDARPGSEPDVEVAYRLTRGAWGRGIATEAAEALVAHALGPLGLARVVAVTYPANQASQRVLDKLGFERRGLREYKGVRVSYHVLTRETWAARASRPSVH